MIEYQTCKEITIPITAREERVNYSLKHFQKFPWPQAVNSNINSKLEFVISQRNFTNLIVWFLFEAITAYSLMHQGLISWTCRLV